jgi:hypothetical protein
MAVFTGFKALTQELFSSNAFLQVVFAIKWFLKQLNFVELILYPHEF